MSILKETATVINQKEISPGIFDLKISFPGGADQAKPGQFVGIYCKDGGRLLPRPISICGIDKAEGTIRIVYRIAGSGTREISGWKEGDTFEILGPLGNGFTPGEGRAIIVGGGIGVPPMLELARQMAGVKTVVLGYRDSGNMFLKEEFEAIADVKVSTDDGSAGIHGTVVDAIREYGITGDTIYACGPLCLRPHAHVEGPGRICRRTWYGSPDISGGKDGLWGRCLSGMYREDKVQGSPYQCK